MTDRVCCACCHSQKAVTWWQRLELDAGDICAAVRRERGLQAHCALAVSVLRISSKGLYASQPMVSSLYP